MTLAGKVVVLTGARRGIGRELRDQLRLAGAVVVGCSRRGDAENDIRQVDVSQPREVEAFVESVYRLYGRLDIALANAGVIETPVPLQALSLSSYQRVVRTNVDGVFFLLKAALAVLIPQRHGFLGITGSQAGRRGLPHLSAYSCSKFAVRGMFQSLSRELQEADVPIETALFTLAGVDTDMRRIAEQHSGRCSRKSQSVHHVAKQIVNVLAIDGDVRQGLEVTIADDGQETRSCLGTPQSCSA